MDLRPIWVPCDCCKWFWCRIHDDHVGGKKCTCPSMDVVPVDPFKTSLGAYLSAKKDGFDMLDPANF